MKYCKVSEPKGQQISKKWSMANLPFLNIRRGVKKGWNSDFTVEGKRSQPTVHSLLLIYCTVLYCMDSNRECFTQEKSGALQICMPPQLTPTLHLKGHNPLILRPNLGFSWIYFYKVFLNLQILKFTKPVSCCLEMVGHFRNVTTSGSALEFVL